MLFLVEKVDTVLDPENREQWLTLLLTRQTRPVVVSWLNANSFMVARRDAVLRECLLRSSHLLLDGIAMALLMRVAKRVPGQNMNGTDFIPEILRHFKGRKAAVFGTQEPYLSQAATAIEKLGVEVVVRADGFQAEENYEKHIANRSVDLIVLGMGVPKQERVSLRLAQAITTPVVILNGGAILDFMAKRFPRAPRMVRAMRLEWLYRFAWEPRRLWRRYIGTIPELIECAYRLHSAARGRTWK